MRQGEDFGRVRERDGALSGRVKGGKQKNEQPNQRQMGRGLFGDVEAEGRRQQCPSHLRKCKEQQSPPAERVNGAQRREGEDEIDQSEAPWSQQGVEVGSAGLDKDGGGIEGDNVDAAHLLSYHHHAGC